MNGKIKKIIFLIIIISIISIISCKTEKDSINVISDDLKPIIVLIERDPWLMVIGSDSPTFALYSDGTLIYFNKGKGYFSIKLNKNKLQEYIPDIETVKFVFDRLRLAFRSDLVESAEKMINTANCQCGCSGLHIEY